MSRYCRNCGFVSMTYDLCTSCIDLDITRSNESTLNTDDPKLNPKYNAGNYKYPMSPVPVPVLAEVGVAMLEGALKYGYYNFRSVDISTSTYYDAANRHIQAWWEGEEIDPDSGINHISKAISSLVVLRDSMMNDTIVDDRPPATPAGWKEGLNAIAARLHDKYDNDELNIIA